jgi:hypothetical protein
VLRSAAVLKARCPACGHPLSADAGTVRSVRIGVFGATSAGKTSLLMSGFLALIRTVDRDGIRAELLDRATEESVVAFGELVDKGAFPPKTPTELPPPVLGARLRRGRTSYLVYLFDAAGEALVDAEQHARLGYFDDARTLVFVLDPFAIPQVRDSADAAHPSLLHEANPAVHDPEDSYHTTALRLRGYGVDTTRQRLAFVISKWDLLTTLPVARDLKPASAAIRSWLLERELDNLVLATERDFGAVRFFASSVGPAARDEALEPIAWLLGSQGLRLR